VAFVAIVALVFMIGQCDLPYLTLGLLPSPSTSRLRVVRMMLLARPFVFVAAAYTFSLLTRVIRARWHTLDPSRWPAAALLGVLVGVGLRIAPEWWRGQGDRASNETRHFAADPIGREQLVAWADEQMKQLGPDRWARAVFEEDTHEYMHLTALTGLPTLQF